MIEQDWGVHDPRWSRVASDHLTINDTRVHLLRAEPATPTDNPATLLVHGLGGAATNWLDVIGPLAEHGPVVAVDLPGFNHTEPPSPTAARIRAQVQFLRRVLDALDWDRVELHGNSMGGLISILFAGQFTDRVNRLVLTAPAFPGNVAGTLAHMDSSVMGVFAPFVLSPRLGLAALQAQRRRQTAEQLAAATERLIMSPGTRMRPAFRTLGVAQAREAAALPWRGPSLAQATHDLLDMLIVGTSEILTATDAITADMLLVWGDQDRLVTRPAVDALTTCRGDLTRVDLSGVGHVPMIEAPDRWLAAVQDWRAAHSQTVNSHAA